MIQRSGIVPILAMLAVAISGCGRGEPSNASGDGATSSAPRTFTVTGQLRIIDNGHGPGDGDSCDANNYYLPDLVEGAPIVVTDTTGQSVAFSRLPMGTARLNGSISDSVMKSPVHDCVTDFTVTGVPSGSTVYELSIGDRGPIKFTESEASDVSLSIETGIETTYDFDDLG